MKLKDKLITLDKRSKYLRKLIIRGFAAGKRGHIASALSLVEILRVLYDNILKYQPRNTKWVKRDRLILSKGHGCLALYAILSDKKFFPLTELDKFCHFNSLLGGHPEIDIPGVEFSTGSEGHGFSVAIGMALNARYEKSPYKIFVIVGDGECNEGSIWEGALCAAQHHLSNLTLIVDYNKMQSYGPTKDIVNLEPIILKWKSFGFAVSEVDGHNITKLKKVFTKTPLEKNKPSVIICHTVKGKGINFIENDPSWHHKRGITDKDIKKLTLSLEEY